MIASEVCSGLATFLNDVGVPDIATFLEGYVASGMDDEFVDEHLDTIDEDHARALKDLFGMPIADDASTVVDAIDTVLNKVESPDDEGD